MRLHFNVYEEALAPDRRARASAVSSRPLREQSTTIPSGAIPQWLVLAC